MVSDRSGDSAPSRCFGSIRAMELFAPESAMLRNATAAPRKASAIGADPLFGSARDQTVTASCERVGMPQG